MRLKYLKHAIVVALFFPLLCQAAICTLSSGGYKMGPSSFFGATVCSQGKMDSISVNGPLTINSTTLNSVSVNGTVTANQSKIGNLTINGVLTAVSSNFNTVNIKGNAYFTNSKINNINVTQSPWFGSYKIYLRSNTVVNGNIVFTKGHGIVYQSKNAKIVGTIIGGRIKTS